MLGKRARPLQRSTSKMQLLSDNNSVSSIANDSIYHRKHEVSKPFNVGAPRRVIGFNPVKKDLHAVQSPVPGIAIKGSEKTRSARSPRSGLESLLSNRSPSEKRAREGTAVGIKAEDDVAKHSAVANPKALVAIGGMQQECCTKQSEPICISLTCGKQFRSEAVHSDEDDSFREFDVSIFRGLRYFRSRTEVKKACESIFSTASPGSGCGEINSGLLPDMDFLNSCYLCKRHLGLGKDIYMYRGDRAFCSIECRYQHIAFDERQVWYSASVPASSSSLFAASPVAAA